MLSTPKLLGGLSVECIEAADSINCLTEAIATTCDLVDCNIENPGLDPFKLDHSAERMILAATKRIGRIQEDFNLINSERLAKAKDLSWAADQRHNLVDYVFEEIEAMKAAWNDKTTADQITYANGLECDLKVKQAAITRINAQAKVASGEAKVITEQCAREAAEVSAKVRDADMELSKLQGLRARIEFFAWLTFTRG